MWCPLILEIHQKKVRGLGNSNQKKNVVVLVGSREITMSIVHGDGQIL
jgi:hypothetical protein